MMTKDTFQRIQFAIPLIIFFLITIIWINYYAIGFSSFNKNNAVSIFGSIIQGMSALLSVAIAVIIFRIQSLENRNQSLEETTLNHVFKIVGWSYGEWGKPLEKDIKTKNITDRYHQNRLSLKGQGRLPWSVQELERGRDEEQKRLEGIIGKHHKTEETIKRVKNHIPSSMLFLMLPILFSFLLLLVSDTLSVEYNFAFVSIVVLMSAIGISILIKIVFDSVT